MSVTEKDVRYVAALAELAVEDAELGPLTGQLDRIVGFVAQLAELGDPAGSASYIAGPAATPLRDDVVEPADLVRGPATIAPEFIEGFFVVPKLGTLEDA